MAVARGGRRALSDARGCAGCTTSARSPPTRPARCASTRACSACTSSDARSTSTRPTSGTSTSATSAGRRGSLVTFFEFPNAGRGRAGTTLAARLRLAVASEEELGALAERLAAAGADLRGSEAGSLAFADPEGIEVSVEIDTAREAGGLRLRGVTLHGDPEVDRATVRDLLGIVGDAVEHVPPPPPPVEGELGAGTIHHVAWIVAPDELGRGASASSTRAWTPTPIRDRRWFRSVYFRLPGGVLFELATDGLGWRRTGSATVSSCRRGSRSCARAWSARSPRCRRATGSRHGARPADPVRAPAARRAARHARPPPRPRRRRAQPRAAARRARPRPPAARHHAPRAARRRGRLGALVRLRRGARPARADDVRRVAARARGRGAGLAAHDRRRLLAGRGHGLRARSRHRRPVARGHHRALRATSRRSSTSTSRHTATCASPSRMGISDTRRPARPRPPARDRLAGRSASTSSTARAPPSTASSRSPSMFCRNRRSPTRSRSTKVGPG